MDIYENNFNDIISLLSTYLFKECNEICKVNMKQVHSIINLLVKYNIPFSLTFSQGTNSSAKAITLQIIFSPTTSISKLFQLQEGIINT